MPRENKFEKGKHLTVEDIRKVKGYEDLSDTEAQRRLISIRQYVQLLVHFASNQIDK